MGIEKDIEIAKDEARDHVVRQKGWICSRCGDHPPYSELPVYFETGMCGWCAHMVAKDD